jgi:hypothetical protein
MRPDVEEPALPARKQPEGGGVCDEGGREYDCENEKAGGLT